MLRTAVAPLVASLLACAEPVPSRAVTVTVDGSAAVAEISDRFLSFAVDAAQAAGGYFWDADATVGTEGTERVAPYDFTRPRLRRLAAALAPAYLRIGGTAADRLYYDLSAEPVTTPPEGYEEVLTAAIWDGVADFARELDLEIFFTLDAGLGPRDAEKQWTPDNARTLIEYSVAHEVPVAVWELGNEVNAYPLLLGLYLTGADFAADAAIARALIDEVDPTGLLAAPSSAYWPAVGEIREIYADFLEAGGGDSLDLITWHYYPQQSVRCPLATRRAEPGLMLQPENLDEVATWIGELEAARDQYAPQLPIWLGETGNAQCGGEPGVSDAFEGSFWWLDELGQLARAGQPVVIRQTLSGSNYGLIDEATLSPNPDYFASLLWRRLMGTEVLAVAVDDPLLRAYAHCTRASAPGCAAGAVTVLLINLDGDREAEVDLAGLGVGDAEWYQVTAAELSSRKVRLNGDELAVAEDGSPPALEADPHRPSGDHSRVTLASHAYGFAVLPDASAPACR